MKRFHNMIERWILTVYPGIGILILNLVCSYANIKGGANDWTLLWNAFGVMFSIRILVNWYQYRKEHKKIEAEIIEMQRRFNETMERHRTRSDESNSDKT